MDMPFSPPAMSRQMGMGVEKLRTILHGVLVAGFLGFVFIGLTPFSVASVAERADGSALNRLVLLGLTGLAALVLALYYRRLPNLVWGALGSWAISALALSSFLWSDHPDLTVRRAIVLICYTVIAAGVAAGINDLRKATKIFCYFAAGLMAFNLATLVIVPDLAISAIGAQGMYGQKNTAGMVAMFAVLAHAAWLFGWRHSPGQALVALLMLTISLAFLVLTESKTSLALAILGIGLFLGYRLMMQGGPIVVLAAALATLAASIGFIILLTVNDFNLGSVLSLVIADTSFTGRDELWAFSARVAMERPWLGHGYGAFWDVGPGADPVLRVDPGSWLGDTEPGLINQAHSGYLELALHLGIPATILATLVVMVAMARGFLHAVIADPRARPAFFLLALMALMYILHNFTEASLFMRGIMFSSVMQVVIFLAARADAFGPDQTNPARRHRS